MGCRRSTTAGVVLALPAVCGAVVFAIVAVVAGPLHRLDNRLAASAIGLGLFVGVVLLIVPTARRTAFEAIEAPPAPKRNVDIAMSVRPIAGLLVVPAILLAVATWRGADGPRFYAAFFGTFVWSEIVSVCIALALGRTGRRFRQRIWPFVLPLLCLGGAKKVPEQCAPLVGMAVGFAAAAVHTAWARRRAEGGALRVPPASAS